MGRRYDFEWNYYSQNRPRKVEGGIKTRSDRGSIGESWWSKRWVNVLEALGMGTRLTRGRSYARQGQVLSIDIETGLVKAKVQGSMAKPYTIKIRLQPLSNQDWEKVTDAMASQAIFAAKLLAGEMPTNIEEAFDAVSLSLFPTTQQDLQTDCSCPDWANPCKHIAAVYYILAERFDEDPFLIFKLRGRTKEEIIKALREKRAEALSGGEISVSTDVSTNANGNEQPLQIEETPDSFWQAGEELDTFAVNPHDATVNKAILKRLGAAPFSVAGENLAAVLGRAYDAVEEAALRKARGDD
ncbi:MAG: SWIM zinc finger family protein [Ktedonobacteraceae bacterium]|nr:SWIM zinc finger family protein [Ktedonobacteraceae bacterium]MBV9614683.1 SWIM zinc finger family protein [Ktedonobacteraceae bacterium]MBV9712759.1 SWIM zinc finger family protein [Ktedonobacteraceae bacterium]